MSPAHHRIIDASSAPDGFAARRASAKQNRPVDQVWRDLLIAARARYRGCGPFAWFFAGSKLGWDPVFRKLLERGDIAANAHVLDIGCGQGLLASLLAAVDDVHQQGRWPASWPAAPIATRYTGIELMRRDAERASRALSSLPSQPTFICADMTAIELPPCDAVVILDVLHYVDQSAQHSLLTRVRDSLSSRGRLLLRIGDMAAARGFATSQWTDRIITSVRGHRIAPTYCRPLQEWVVLLEQIGFVQVRSVPMSAGTPFANVLLVAEKS